MNVDIGGPSGRSRSRKRTEGVSTGQYVVMTIIPMVVVKPKVLAPVLAQCPPKLQAEGCPILQVHESGKIVSL